MRRIGVLMNRAADNPEGQAAVAVFRQALQQLGWGDDRNVRIDARWGVNDIDRIAATRRNWLHSRRMLFWPAAS